MEYFECCPLCSNRQVRSFSRDTRRDYYQCERCQLVFVPPDFYLSSAEEKAEYDLHQNSVYDPNYRKFLSRLAEPLLARIPPRASGLDFGCGPAPALATILEEGGHTVALYDLFYHDNSEVLSGNYQFVTATEVVEHLHQPGLELDRLWDLVAPGGWLAIMTKLVIDAEAFSRWHYKNDPTHVVFFSRATWTWWARNKAAHLEILGSDVILLRRPQ